MPKLRKPEKITFLAHLVHIVVLSNLEESEITAKFLAKHIYIYIYIYIYTRYAILNNIHVS